MQSPSDSNQRGHIDDSVCESVESCESLDWLFADQSPSDALFKELELEETRLHVKVSSAHRREVSHIKNIRNRREHVGQHNWSRVWDTMPTPFEPKVPQRDRTTGIWTPRKWVDEENLGDPRTAARLSYWRKGMCGCYSCDDLYTSMLNSYTRLQKANLQKLVRQYQRVKNGVNGPNRLHSGQTRKGTDWTDVAWELEMKSSDEVFCEDDFYQPPSLATSHSVDIMDLLKPGKRPRRQAVKAAPWRTLKVEAEPASPVLSILSSDSWDDISVASMDDFVLL
ncbi:hypothetical protein M408DRAFT_329748 [Serendipita vermifera MAFF 305830]|uniref:Uncharacterized protein n=1 Tax=Serendipita vermifera MAFF 305830 TaxID=933852 RepID=A0A0C3B8J4_SERVB|nr:hypothetical protein M408DRAFT_329748 [Serendipita vermifera MAFF 305830]